uniref:Uncharacterized protein n=1 Tax=Kalanchoe fedtschenkoi TaxID=63787 RepID=A0A7N0U273_KALFE
MAGIAILSDLLRRKSGFYSSQSLHSYSSLSAKVAISASAAASIAASRPFAYRALFGDDVNSPRLAYCDAAATTFYPDDNLSKIGNISENIFQHEPKQIMQKEYYIELKPLWHAFRLKQFAITSLRSFLLHYLPLLEPRKDGEEDDDDMFLHDNRENKKVDLVTPFKKSVLQIIRETSAVTTRRVLERVTVYYVSQRTAWKLLKDASKSAMRKAQRGIPTYVYIFRVGRTTFRTHFLVVASQWLIDVVTETIIYLRPPRTSELDADTVEKREQAKHLGKKIVVATIKGVASLIFATVGAAIFATLFRPSLGQWIGCIIGDLAGPIIIVHVLEKYNLEF